MKLKSKPWINKTRTPISPDEVLFHYSILYDAITNKELGRYFIPSKSWTDQYKDFKWFWQISNDIIEKLRALGIAPNFYEHQVGNFCPLENTAKENVEKYIKMCGYEILDSKYVLLE